jgi:hypothetical protein
MNQVSPVPENPPAVRGKIENDLAAVENIPLGPASFAGYVPGCAPAKLKASFSRSRILAS